MTDVDKKLSDLEQLKAWWERRKHVIKLFLFAAVFVGIFGLVLVLSAGSDSADPPGPPPEPDDETETRSGMRTGGMIALIISLCVLLIPLGILVVGMFNRRSSPRRQIDMVEDEVQDELIRSIRRREIAQRKIMNDIARLENKPKAEEPSKESKESAAQLDKTNKMLNSLMGLQKKGALSEKLLNKIRKKKLSDSEILEASVGELLTNLNASKKENDKSIDALKKEQANNRSLADRFELQRRDFERTTKKMEKSQAELDVLREKKEVEVSRADTRRMAELNQEISKLGVIVKGLKASTQLSEDNLSDSYTKIERLVYENQNLDAKLQYLENVVKARTEAAQKIQNDMDNQYSELSRVIVSKSKNNKSLTAQLNARSEELVSLAKSSKAENEALQKEIRAAQEVYKNNVSTIRKNQQELSAARSKNTEIEDLNNEFKKMAEEAIKQAEELSSERQGLINNAKAVKKDNENLRKDLRKAETWIENERKRQLTAKRQAENIADELTRLNEKHKRMNEKRLKDEEQLEIQKQNQMDIENNRETRSVSISRDEKYIQDTRNKQLGQGRSEMDIGD